MGIKVLILFVFLFLPLSSYAQDHMGTFCLTAGEVDRIRAIKGILGSVDSKSVLETIKEIENSRHPEINLALKEAMAHAYVDIVREIKVEGLHQRKWLYSMVCLNMAYLQFGGDQGKRGSTTELNRLIRHKLKEYLPPSLYKQQGFTYTLE